MKTLLILLLVCLFACNKKDQEFKMLAPLEQIDILLKQAKCLPKLSKDKAEFCTGILFNKEQLNELFGQTFKQCLNKIKQSGYQNVFENNKYVVDKKLWNSFFYTTKWAESIHDQKVVLFKNVAGKNDCLHEYLHILQQKQEDLLSPKVRQSVIDKITSNLTADIKVIEKYEKKGNKKIAHKLGMQLQKIIYQIKDLQGLKEGIDEKEIYYFFYKYCNDGLVCSKSYGDIVIGNLFKRSQYLPWRERDLIRDQVISKVEKHERQAIKKISFKKLSKKKVKAVFKRIKKLDRVQLVKYIKKQGILFAPLTKSKTSQNSDISGRFFCYSKGSKNLIHLDKSASNGTIIHEYFHYLQSKQNPEYCKALTEQEIVKFRFEKGLISRQIYESTILKYKMLNRMAEYEVYSILLEHDDLFNEKEKLNNKAQYLVYKTRTFNNKQATKLDTVKLKQAYKIIIKNDLPHIKLRGKEFILDLGAMDSIVPPKEYLNRISDIRNIEVIKLKSVGNALGQVVEAPYIKTSYDIKALLVNLKNPGVEYVLGIDFLRKNDLIIDIENKELKLVSFESVPPGIIELRENHRGELDAVEMICGEDIFVRLDSGSQVFGDIKTSYYAKNKNHITCKDMQIEGDFKHNIQNDIIFNRDIVANLGWPFLKKYKQIKISFKNRWIQFL